MFFEGGFPFGGGMPGGFPGGGFPGGGRGGPRKDVDTTKFYTILGVDKNADSNTIKKAYRKLALAHHPDRGGDAEKFKELTKAYEVLCDDDKRKVYDEMGEDGLDGPGGAGGPDPHDIFSAMFGGGGGGRSRGPQVRRGEDMNHVISVTLEQLYNGVTKKMSLNKEVICVKCKGEGSAKVKVCGSCDGQGKRIAMKRMGPMVTQQVVACPDCKGRGKSFDEKDRCGDCKGNGLNKEKKVLEVVVTKGMGNNSKISFRGEADQKPGFEPGDVNFIVKEEAHKTFKRVGDHLTINHSVSLIEALTGFGFVIEHLDGRKLLIKSTPQRVYKPGDKLVVKEEGMPIEGRAFSKGHLVVLLDVIFPTTLNEEAAAALKACLPPATNPAAPKNEDAYEVHYLEEANNIDLSGKKSNGGRAAYEDDDEEEEGHHGHGPNVGCQQV